MSRRRPGIRQERQPGIEMRKPEVSYRRAERKAPLVTDRIVAKTSMGIARSKPRIGRPPRVGPARQAGPSGEITSNSMKTLSDESPYPCKPNAITAADDREIAC